MQWRKNALAGRADSKYAVQHCVRRCLDGQVTVMSLPEHMASAASMLYLAGVAGCGRASGRRRRFLGASLVIRFILAR